MAISATITRRHLFNRYYSRVLARFCSRCVCVCVSVCMFGWSTPATRTTPPPADRIHASGVALGAQVGHVVTTHASP